MNKGVMVRMSEKQWDDLNQWQSIRRVQSTVPEIMRQALDEFLARERDVYQRAVRTVQNMSLR